MCNFLIFLFLGFYVFNSGALVALVVLLISVIIYQRAHKKKKFSETVTEQIEEIASLGLGNKDEGEKLSLLDWAKLHDYPVRAGGVSKSYSSIN